MLDVCDAVPAIMDHLGMGGGAAGGGARAMAISGASGALAIAGKAVHARGGFASVMCCRNLRLLVQCLSTANGYSSYQTAVMRPTTREQGGPCGCFEPDAMYSAAKRGTRNKID